VLGFFANITIDQSLEPVGYVRVVNVNGTLSLWERFACPWYIYVKIGWLMNWNQAFETQV